MAALTESSQSKPPQPADCLALPSKPFPSDYLLAYADMSTLTQSELRALSLCSPSAFDLRRTNDVVIPTIDPSTFNESGSGHQIYSRPGPSSPSHQHRHRVAVAGRLLSTKPSPSAEDDPHRGENQLIIASLKNSLRNLPEFYDIDFDYTPPFSGFHENDLSFGERKRKRGRKPKTQLTDVVVEEDGMEQSLEIMNEKGVVVDLVALADMEDPYGAELLRRTEGMGSEEELLDFLRDLGGEWCSRRRKRKIVDASIFGDLFPLNWKLLLALKRREGHVSVYCRRYISPGGRHFESCKEVSLYLQSYFELYDVQDTANRSSQNAQLGVSNRTDDAKRVEELLGSANLAEVQIVDLFECHKCDMSFDAKDAYFQHLMSAHKKTTRTFRPAYETSESLPTRNSRMDALIEIAQNSILDTSKASSAETTKEITASFSDNELKSDISQSEAETEDDGTNGNLGEDPIQENDTDMNINGNMDNISDAWNVVDVNVESCLDSPFALFNDEIGANKSHVIAEKDASPITTVETKRSGIEQETGAEEHLMTSLSMNLVCSSTPEIIKPVKEDERNIGMGTKYGLCDNILGESGKQIFEEKQVCQESMSVLLPSQGYQTFEAISYQRDEELCRTDGNHGNVGTFGELRLDDIEELKFEFGTGQESLSDPVVAMDMEETMEAMFGSSSQYEAEEMLSLACGSQLTTSCVWCGVEFSHESMDSEIQSDSVGYMCTSCKTKISGQLNSLQGGLQ